MQRKMEIVKYLKIVLVLKCGYHHGRKLKYCHFFTCVAYVHRQTSQCLCLLFLTPFHAHSEPVANVISADECHDARKTTSSPLKSFSDKISLSQLDPSVSLTSAPPLPNPYPSSLLLSTNMIRVCVCVLYFHLSGFHTCAQV